MHHATWLSLSFFFFNLLHCHASCQPCPVPCCPHAFSCNVHVDAICVIRNFTSFLNTIFHREHPQHTPLYTHPHTHTYIYIRIRIRTKEGGLQFRSNQLARTRACSSLHTCKFGAVRLKPVLLSADQMNFFSFNPSQKKVLYLVFFVFLGTCIGYHEVLVKVVSSRSSYTSGRTT